MPVNGGKRRRQRLAVSKADRPFTGPVTLRKAVLEDADAIVRTFNEVFGSDRTAAYWRWKYHRLGQLASMLAVDPENNVLAQHAVSPVRYWTPTTGTIAGSVCGDVFAARRSDVVALLLYVRLVRRFISPADGFVSDFAFSIGFPNETSHRVLSHVLEFRYDFALPKYFKRLSWMDRWRAPAATADLRRADIDQLWQRLQAGYSFCVVKDWDWFSWRFLQNPLHAYRFVAIHWPSGELRGWAALLPNDRTLVLVDLTLEPSDAEGFVLLQQRITAHGCALGCKIVIGVLPEWLAHALAIDHAGWRRLSEQATQSMTVYDHGTIPFELGPRPWYSFGDSDLF